MQNLFKRVTPDVVVLELSAPLKKSDSIRSNSRTDWSQIWNHLRTGEYFPALVEYYRERLVQGGAEAMPDMAEAERLAQEVSSTIIYADRPPKVLL